jgi:hypothetical protein
MIKIIQEKKTENPTIWRLYETTWDRSKALKFYLRKGYKYFVTWKDVNGWGLECVWRAAWQDDDSYSYIDQRRKI